MAKLILKQDKLKQRNVNYLSRIFAPELFRFHLW